MPRPFCCEGTMLLSIKLLCESDLIEMGTYLKGFLLLQLIGVFENRLT